MLLRATQGRQGMTLHLPASTQDLLVAGDLHGNMNNLQAILQLAQLDAHPQRHLVLQEFVHSKFRYPAGGCTSHRMLDFLAILKIKYPHRVHLLLGNHELSQWTGRKVAKDDIFMNDLFEQGVASAYADRAADLIEAYNQFFASMLLAVRLPNRVFISHSIPSARQLAEFDLSIFQQLGLNKDQLDRDSSVYQLLWGRDVREETSTRFANLVDADFLVTGHIAQEAGYAFPSPHHLILDSMALPAAVALLPAQNPLTPATLRAAVRLLPDGLPLPLE
jgi:hypothetical protein